MNITKEILENLYISNRYSGEYIAKMYNLSKQTIYNKLKKYNIKIRSYSENILGINNPNWRFGSRNHYVRQAKNILLKNSKEICSKCNSNKKIEIHHIDYNWTNNDLSNLIFLCSKCHRRIHYKLKDYQYKKGENYRTRLKQVLQE